MKKYTNNPEQRDRQNRKTVHQTHDSYGNQASKNKKKDTKK